ncbi:MAG: family 20 glycosylhydrolase [bacterium]|nr:MAG: family 20 glycosylhydrolase [bacterium]
MDSPFFWKGHRIYPFIFSGILLSCFPPQQVTEQPVLPELSVIPRPVSVETRPDWFSLPADLKIIYTDSMMEFTAEFLRDFIHSQISTMINIVITEEVPPDSGIIILSLDETIEHSEGYRLRVNQNIQIQGREPRGVFYGIQTLNQLIFSGLDSTGRVFIPCVEILDYPRFSWRGMHLDVSRHFFDKAFIKKYIDILALHKMNTFHWHLVDDQGWRIEIKKYPRLTEVGAWRVDREELPWHFRPEAQPGEKATYGGFYTQQEIREIVAYASERFITVVPEIEMPAHVQSALAGYPQFSCKGELLTVPPGSIWPITNIYCAGNDSTFLFLQDVLTEVMDLFPSAYIHIGGDEADHMEWERCPKCQARLKNEGLRNEHQLQSYFIQRIENFLNEHDRILIGWDEILDGGLVPNATVMSWRGTRGGIEAARLGHDAVMTPGTHCYFDHYQSLDKDIEPPAFGGFTDLRKVYSYEPVPARLNSEEAAHILGVQGNVWTEFMQTGAHVEYMILPRMTALSEVQWTLANLKSEEDFLGRLPAFLNLLKRNDINYHLPTPQGLIQKMIFVDSIHINLTNPYPFGEIRYTLNGDDPRWDNSMVFNQTLKFESNQEIRAALFLENGHRGLIRSSRIIQQHPLPSSLPDISIEQGLHYRLYEGEICSLNDFSELTFLYEGIIDQIRIPADAPNEHFAVELAGYIKIPFSGMYTFTLSSNDGSRLYIDNQLVVDHDHFHRLDNLKGQIALAPGFHTIHILYFEYIGEQKLEMLMEGPDFPEQLISSKLLFHEVVSN